MAPHSRFAWLPSSIKFNLTVRLLYCNGDALASPFTLRFSFAGDTSRKRPQANKEIAMRPTLRHAFIHFVLPVFAALLLVSSAALGQTDTGRISGTIKDQNGAIVPGVTVTVRNDRTGDERTGVANADGSYTITALKASVYTVTATATDLSAKVENVSLNVGQELTINLALSPTGVSATVNVIDSEETLASTGSAAMGAN